METLEMLEKLQRLCKQLRRDLNRAAMPLHPRVRQILEAESCRFAGSSLDLEEAHKVAAEWLAYKEGFMFRKEDFQSETGAALAWGRASLLEDRCAHLRWLVETGAFDCRLHAETPREALLLMWRSRPDGEETLGWRDEFLREAVRTLIKIYED